MSRENVEVARQIYEDFLTGKTEFDTEGVLTKMPGEELTPREALVG